MKRKEARASYPAILNQDVQCQQLRDYAKRIAELKEKKGTTRQADGHPLLVKAFGKMK